MARIKSNTNAQIIARYKLLQSRINLLTEKAYDKRISVFDELTLDNLTREFEIVKTSMVLLQLEIPNDSNDTGYTVL